MKNNKLNYILITQKWRSYFRARHTTLFWYTLHFDMPFDILIENLLDAAFESLTDKFKQDHSNYDSVKLIIDNVNGDTFTFLLYNYGDNFRWERKIRYKQNDTSKIPNPIDSLKYIGEKLIPTITEQQGMTDLEDPKEIFSMAKSLFELDNTEKNDNILIDGTEYWLQIKLANRQKDFKWKAIPLGWNEVEIIANKIIELNNKIY